MSTTCKYLVFILLQKICQHIAVEDLLQLFAPFAVSNIPSIMFQQFCDIFLTEIRCLQCLQITVIRLKQIFDPLFAGALVAPSLSSLKQMIQICEQFAESQSITFNPSKTKLLCFNMKLESKVPPIYLNGERVSIVENEKHLGNYVSTDIEDRNIIADVCDLYQRSNLLISDFRACDSITLDSLHKIYCMHMYGSELWNLNCRYVDEFKVAWRKVKRRIWRLPSNTHNVIIQNLTYNIDDQLDARMAKFIHMCLNHDNDVCRSISLSKLLCKNSTFASNYSYLSCKYNLSHHDWHLDTSHLIGKVRLKNK